MTVAAARRRIDPLHLVDVFIYVVVLDLTTQFVPGVIIESFAVSLATAIMLKLVLEVVLRVKTAVRRRLRAATTVQRRATSLLMLVLILPGSKYIVLWLEDALFGDAVTLGGFWAVTLLVLALTAARWGVCGASSPRASPPSDPRGVGQGEGGACAPAGCAVAGCAVAGCAVAG